MSANTSPTEQENTRREALLVAWLARCAQGNPEGLEKLYETLSPQLFGVLLRILKRRALAEEALQDTFINVWRKASEYRAERGRITTWIFTIARHRAFDILRRHQELTVEPDKLIRLSDANSAVQPGDDEQPRSHTEQRRLQQCLDALSEQQRSSIMMAYFQGLTQEEIARHYETPLGTVKSWVRRALISLKRCLEA